MKKLILTGLAVFGLLFVSGSTLLAGDEGFGQRFYDGNHGRFHDELDHRRFHRELDHREAHRYPMTWWQHDRLHDGLDHEAYHDHLDHRGYHRVRPYYYGYPSHGRYYYRPYSGYRSYGHGVGFSGNGVSLWFGF